jgi:uncharacterized membrane protein YheB (UPF0754 family)
MKTLLYLLIPIISALIGWLTNYIAVKMIFRPRREITIFGIKVIGLIPKRKKDLAKSIATTVEKELISHKDIGALIQSPEFHAQTSKVLHSKIEEFINSKVSSNSMLMMFVTPDMVAKLSSTLMEELEKEIPGMMNTLFTHVEEKLDFRAIVEQKILDLDLSKLESIIYQIASRELKAIEYLGGILGFLIGLVQIAIIIIGEWHG